jgi:hypothetical protein
MVAEPWAVSWKQNGHRTSKIAAAIEVFTIPAGNVADFRLYDCSGTNHDRFGLFRDRNAAESRGLSGDADHRGVLVTSERLKSAAADFGLTRPMAALRNP